MSKKNKKQQNETQNKRDLQLAKEVATRNVAEYISGLTTCRTRTPFCKTMAGTSRFTAK